MNITIVHHINVDKYHRSNGEKKMNITIVHHINVDKYYKSNGEKKMNITIVHHINVDKYYKSNGEKKMNNLCSTVTCMVPLVEIFTNAQNFIVNLLKWTVMFQT